MLATNDTVRRIRSAARKQYEVIARGKVSNGCMAVGAKLSDVNVSRRGLSRNARMWHCFTEGGEPVCDVCKRVGHVARNCWLKKKSSERFKGRGTIVHSVVKNQEGCTVVERHVAVSVGGRQLEALLDCNAMENAVNFEIVKVDPKLKMYDFQDRDRTNSTWRLGTRGMVWLPIVIGSRSDKLRCVVVEGLTEKLIIGLPGLSYLGASIDFATGDVHIGHRRRKKVKDNTMVKKGDELHENQALVRDSKIKCMESKDTAGPKVVSSKKKSPESGNKRLKECTGSQLPEQVKDLTGKEKELRDVDRVKDCLPNQIKGVDPVSGRGRKEGKVNVVSPKQDKPTTTITTTTTTTITPDHSDEKSEGDCDSGDEDSSDPEELETCSTEDAKMNKSTRKAKRRKGKKKKKGRRKR